MHYIVSPLEFVSGRIGADVALDVQVVTFLNFRTVDRPTQ